MYTVNEDFRLKRLAKLVENRSVVVDIGFAQSPNPFLNNEAVIGVDIEAASKPSNYSEVFLGTLENFERQGRRADAIVAGEILEHLENPAEFLSTCNRVLLNGGVLVISTPNPNSPIERLLTLSLSRRYFYTKDHIFLFPQRWLIRILERCGFENVSLQSGGFPMPGFGLIPFPRPWCHQTIAVAEKT